MRVRDARPSDRALVERMLFEAFFWDAAVPRPSFEAFRASEPDFEKLLRDLAARAGDCAVVAEPDSDAAVGAAWFRYWTEAEHSYGYVAPDVPELAIGVDAGARGRGVGRALMRALIERARAHDVRALSLSVDPRNVAARLYRSLGFVEVGRAGTSRTLLLELRER